MVFGFGVVHGLCLATRLQALGLPADGTIGRVLAFNLGAELGQLAAVTVIYLAGTLVRDRVSWPVLPRVAAGALVTGGLAAAVLVPLTATGELPFAAGRSAACTVYDQPAGYPSGTSGPAQAFIEPATTVSDDVYGHAVANGYVVVRYQPTLPATALQQRTAIADLSSCHVVAGPAEQPTPITASTAQRTLRCTGYDEDVLRHFIGGWLSTPRPGR